MNLLDDLPEEYTGPGSIGPKPEGNGWYKCGCHCHAAAKRGMKVYHCVPCCAWGWKQWSVARAGDEDDGSLD